MNIKIGRISLRPIMQNPESGAISVTAKAVKYLPFGSGQFLSPLALHSGPCRVEVVEMLLQRSFGSWRSSIVLNHCSAPCDLSHDLKEGNTDELREPIMPGVWRSDRKFFCQIKSAKTAY